MVKPPDFEHSTPGRAAEGVADDSAEINALRALLGELTDAMATLLGALSEVPNAEDLPHELSRALSRALVSTRAALGLLDEDIGHGDDDCDGAGAGTGTGTGVDIPAAPPDIRERARASLRDVIAEMANALNVILPERVRLVIESEGTIPMRRADARSAVQNLVTNAARAAGRNGKVTISLRDKRGYVEFVVDDDGPGFGQVPTHSGIGLMATSTAVIRSGGSITVGRSPLGGARVRLRWPASG